jgi:DHA3 family tetracycline resistance protein-like MFS transporter
MGLSFNMMFTAAGLYRIDIAQLEIYQLILIGTALEIAIFFFELPTGIVADLKSRKTSVIIGLFIVGIGILIEALTPLFLFIFISQVVWGLGYTFISGAMDSWISDEVDKELLEHTIITGSQVYKIMSVLGIVLAAVIGMFNIRYAIYTSSIIFVLMGIFAIYTMKEDNFTKPSGEIHFYKRYFQQLANGFSHRTKEIIDFSFKRSLTK